MPFYLRTNGWWTFGQTTLGQSTFGLLTFGKSTFRQSKFDQSIFGTSAFAEHTNLQSRTYAESCIRNFPFKKNKKAANVEKLFATKAIKQMRNKKKKTTFL